VQGNIMPEISSTQWIIFVRIKTWENVQESMQACMKQYYIGKRVQEKYFYFLKMGLTQQY
jgi:hypothetical protein